MPDARKKTDIELEKMEKKLKSLYTKAESELSHKWNAFAKAQEPKLKQAYDSLQEAQKSKDWKEINKAKAEYERILRNTTLNNDRYKALVDETTEKLAHTNEIALNIINSNMSEIYLINYNSFGDLKVKGYSFSIMNEDALRNIVKADRSFLPYKQLNKYKDKIWNEKQINSQLFQGILQGEDIRKIAKRLQNVTNMNRESAIRNARTMTTAAENKGLQDSTIKAAEDGIIIVRRWVATNDNRTRDWHAELDGEEVGVDEPWENEYGEIMYPGDPDADPANTYNCRCRFVRDVKGFAWNFKGGA